MTEKQDVCEDCGFNEMAHLEYHMDYHKSCKKFKAKVLTLDDVPDDAIVETSMKTLRAKNHSLHSGTTPVKKGEKSTSLEDTPSVRNPPRERKRDEAEGTSKSKGCGKEINWIEKCGKENVFGKLILCLKCKEKK